MVFNYGSHSTNWQNSSISPGFPANFQVFFLYFWKTSKFQVFLNKIFFNFKELHFHTNWSFVQYRYVKTSQDTALFQPTSRHSFFPRLKLVDKIFIKTNKILRFFCSFLRFVMIFKLSWTSVSPVMLIQCCNDERTFPTTLSTQKSGKWVRAPPVIADTFGCTSVKKGSAYSCRTV